MVISNEMLRKRYRFRFNVRGVKSLLVGVPYEFVDREARKLNLTVDQFVEQYRAIAHYDGSGILHYTFEKI